TWGGLRTVADAIVDVEQLPPMTDEPVIVQGEHDRHTAIGERSHDAGGKTCQMMDVRGVRPNLVDDARGHRVDRGVLVRFLEGVRISECVVDPRDRQTTARLASNAVVRPRRILLARQHRHLVAVTGRQRERMFVRVDLAAALSRWRKPMDDYEEAHQTILNRTGFHRRDADKPPPSWPSGHATARATARAMPLVVASFGAVRSHLRCSAMDVAIACIRSVNVGMVRSSKSSYSRRCRRYVRASSYR